MVRFLRKSKPIETQIEYSEKWFDENSCKSLRDLYSDFLKVKIGDHDPFILDLSERIRSFFSIPFEKIQLLSEFELYIKLPEDQKVFLNSLDDKDLSNWYDKMLSELKDIYAETIIESLRRNELKHSLSGIKSNIPALIERCFSFLVFDSLKGVEVIKKTKPFHLADTRILFIDILEATLNPDFFDGHLFRLCKGDSQKRINKWFSIAMNNSIDKIDSLSDEEQIALIPKIELILKHEQNYKISKEKNYKGIKKFEKFYLLILKRFEKKLNLLREKQFNESVQKKLDIFEAQIEPVINKDESFKVKKHFFYIGKKTSDSPKIMKKNKEKFRTFFKRIKHKFSNNYSLSDFESLYESTVNYVEKFDCQIEIKELIFIVKFLKEKEIISQYKMWKIVKNRFLINGEEIAMPEKELAQISKSINLELNKEVYKTLNSYLE